MPWSDWLQVDAEIQAAQEGLVGELRRRGVEVVEAQPDGFDLRAHESLYNALLAVIDWSGRPMGDCGRLAEE